MKAKRSVHVAILWVTTGATGLPTFNFRHRSFWGQWAGCLQARQTDRITILLSASVQCAGVSLFKKHRIPIASKVQPLSAHLPSSSVFPPCVFKRACTTATAASCPRGTAVFVLMAGSHPLLFICSRFANLTFRCLLLYAPTMTEGRWQGLCIPPGSRVEKIYGLTAACCSIFFFNTDRRCWCDGDRAKWPDGNLSEKEKRRRHECQLLFYNVLQGSCVNSGWWRGIKRKKIKKNSYRAKRGHGEIE